MSRARQLHARNEAVSWCCLRCRETFQSIGALAVMHPEWCGTPVERARRDFTQ